MHAYFYDNQVRRYIQQFIRLFSGFNVEMGKKDFGETVYQTVPVRYGDISRMAGHVLKENSENFMSSVPFISCYITEMSIAPERRANHNYTNTVQLAEKRIGNPVHTDEGIDMEPNRYQDGEIGNTYSVTRYMAVPYDLTFNVDIWTSSTEQKLQLLEQILVLYNPSINIHTNSNIADWTTLSYVELIGTTWSSRSIPQGIDEQLEISTLTFNVPIFISPPAKVQRQSLIHTIINRIHDVDTNAVIDGWDMEENFSSRLTSYKIVTFEQYHLNYRDGKAELLLEEQIHHGTPDKPLRSTTEWNPVLENYCEMRPGISQIRMRRADYVENIAEDIVGYLYWDDDDPKKIVVDIDPDTLPTNDHVISAIINPQRAWPGENGGLPAPEVGHKYLVLDEMPEGELWNYSTAKAYDIVEWNGSDWVVAFNASANTGAVYVENLMDGNQYEWTGQYWQNSVEGVYRPGFWRVYL